MYRIYSNIYDLLEKSRTVTLLPSSNLVGFPSFTHVSYIFSDKMSLFRKLICRIYDSSGVFHIKDSKKNVGNRLI